jgi:cell division protein FtsB
VYRHTPPEDLRWFSNPNPSCGSSNSNKQTSTAPLAERTVCTKQTFVLKDDQSNANGCSDVSMIATSNNVDKKKKSANNKWWWILIALLVILALIGLAIYLGSRTQSQLKQQQVVAAGLQKEVQDAKAREASCQAQLQQQQQQHQAALTAVVQQQPIVPDFVDRNLFPTEPVEHPVGGGDMTSSTPNPSSDASSEALPMRRVGKQRRYQPFVAANYGVPYQRKNCPPVQQ